MLTHARQQSRITHSFDFSLAHPNLAVQRGVQCDRTAAAKRSEDVQPLRLREDTGAQLIPRRGSRAAFDCPPKSRVRVYRWGERFSIFRLQRILKHLSTDKRDELHID